MSYILEICVDSVESAIAAKNGGANRIELCGNLVIGGTTPSIELFNEISKTINIDANVLIRPRFGDFYYTDHEFNIIKKEIELFKNAGANGVVIGVLTKDGNLDIKRMKELMDIAKGMEVTLHRAFDVTKDPYKTLKEVEDLGINTILTSGQKSSAEMAMDFLEDLRSKTDKVNILVGGGVNFSVVESFLNNTTLKSYHMSGKEVLKSEMEYRNSRVYMGIPSMSEFEIWRTKEENVRAVRELLNSKE